MVFGSMLSDDEVQAIYVATSVDEPPSINVQDFAAMASGKLVGYWKLDGNAVDESANGLTGTPVNEEWVDGFSGLAFYLSGDDTIRVHDGGSSPLDVDNVLMLAWVMPTDWATVADRGIIMNKSVAPLPVFALVSQSWCVIAERLLLLPPVAEKAPTSTVCRTASVHCKEPSDQAAGAGGALPCSQ